MSTARERFEALGRFLDEDEAEQIAQAARRDPGDKLAESLRLWDASLEDYRRQLQNPGVAAMEDERAWHKSDLHDVWRRRHRPNR